MRDRCTDLAFIARECSACRDARERARLFEQAIRLEAALSIAQLEAMLTEEAR